MAMKGLPMLRLVMVAALLAAGACSSDRATRSKESKIEAPVDLELTAVSSAEGLVTATMRVRALVDVPSAVCRVVIPQGSSIKEGQAETDLGAMAAGEQRQVMVVLSLPVSGASTLAAGVDVQMASGVKLNVSRTVALGGGEAPAAPTRVVKLPDGETVRMGQAEATAPASSQP